MRKNSYLWGIIMCWLLAAGLSSHGQVELKKITPLSPNAAEIVRYGETPINYFTGTTGIGIPLYTVASGSLQLPLSLSYHSGGNKVESVSSWVGLSWSLGNIPSISRAVNGLPDENGYFNRYMGKTVKELKQLRLEGDRQDYDNFLREVAQGTADAEPDVYSYNIIGASGKFYFNQTLNRFVTSPHTNVKITYNATGFTIIGEDGVQYYFSNADSETNQTGGTSQGAQVISTWMVSSIKSATSTDQISFAYVLEQNITQRISGELRYQLLNSLECQDLMAENYLSVLTNIQRTRRLDVISFRGGTVKFTPEVNEREDLFGGHALGNIKVFSAKGSLVKHYTFGYTYLTGTGDAGLYRNNKWMLLANVNEMSLTQAQQLTHSFTYDQGAVPPSRTSTAQDYWGYYNGKTSNNTLIPSLTYKDLQYDGIYIPGADRSVSPQYTQFGLLNRITYPTGGYTTYEYENNKVVDPDAPPVMITKFAAIEPDTDSPEPTLPNHKEFTTEFTINNSLQAGNGGNVSLLPVSVTMDGLGASPGSQQANVYIKGLTGDFTNQIITLSDKSSKIKLPNGTYRLYAVFNQDPPMYGSFFCIVEWKEVDPSVNYSYAGGLRIKEVRTYDGIKNIPLIKQFFYETALNSGVGSGQLNGYNNFNYTNRIANFFYRLHENGAFQRCGGEYLRLSSLSNQTQVTHSGSYVGYKNVIATTSSPEQTGYISYSYTHEKDVPYINFPFPPPMSREEFRGQLKEQKEYIYTNGAFQLAREITNYFHAISHDEQEMVGITIDPNLKEDPAVSFPVPAASFYEIIPNWSELALSTERLYDKDPSKYIETGTSYLYDDNYHRLVETDKTGSDGKVQKSLTYYPDNLSLTGDEESARSWLVNANCINIPLKQEEYVDNSLLSTTNTAFKNFDGQNLVQPSRVGIQYGNNGPVKAVFFDQYDAAGNLVEQHKANDIVQSYIWGYNNKYVVAEIVGKSFNAAVSESGINLTVVNDIATTATAMNAELQKLYSLSGCFVTTYTYELLTGLTKQTDANGKPAYFEYDDFGRLFIVRDQDQNILKSYCYQYYGQRSACDLYGNIVKTQTFTKQGCNAANAEFPETITYTVSPNTYYGLTQADADSKAQNDINTNGQTAANATACTIGVWNDERTASFRRSCGTGFEGSLETYTVPANRYAARTKQEANALADADIAANGQNHANNVGICIEVCSSQNCGANYSKCINGACEYGVPVNINTYRNGNIWFCVWRYEWSDGTYSPTWTVTSVGVDCSEETDPNEMPE